MRVKMCSVLVDDPAAAFEFYTAVLGFSEVAAVPEADLYVVGPSAGAAGTALLLEPRGTDAAAEFARSVFDAGLPVVILGHPDVMSVAARLRARDVVILAEPDASHDEPSLIFADGHGNLLQVHQDP